MSMAYRRMFSFDGTSHLCCILRHSIRLACIDPLSGATLAQPLK